MNASQQMAARRYRIERYLTEGGMGAIYIGKKLGPGGFEKEVVLKQLLPEYTSRPEFRDLFFREAKISATLDHANIVHTFDLVESDESLFIVMEYVRGVDLRTIVRRARLRRRDLVPAAAIHITLDVLAGLGYAHARRDPSGASMGIIHRDVSPSNILCSVQGEVKLSDFGIAKASTHSSVFYRVRGKVGYMSPEQARNEPIDHRSDLYSLAVCLYEALTGERLFVGDLSTPPDVIYGQPIIAPSKKRPGLHPALDEVMAKALAVKPADRYQDAAAFSEALRQLAHRSGLVFSAPQLAEHLRDILGSDPLRWLHDDTAAQPTEGGTQKIPIKDLAKELEGKEAASIGVVEGSNLYVVSGGDVVSPVPAGTSKQVSAPDSGKVPVSPSRPDSPRPPLSRPGGQQEPARRVTAPIQSGRPGMAGRDPFIPIHEDDEDEPTRARDKALAQGPAPSPAAAAAMARRPATAPYAPVASGRRPSIPPPPPAAAFTPPVPPFAHLPPAPPRPQPRPFRADSPFDSDMPTPPPPPSGDEFYPPTPASLFQTAPPRGGPPPGAPSAPVWAPPPLNLQAPETIDFAAGSQPLVAKRTGPPGLLILIVLLGAAAGGAKLAHVVTRSDLAALAASSEASSRRPATGTPPPGQAPPDRTSGAEPK